MKKEKYQMTSNQKKNEAYINWSMTSMNKVRLYFSMIIMKHPNRIKSKEDL